MRHHVIILLRTLWRERLYAALNVAGLSLGLACCLLLGLFLRSELTYDRYHLLQGRIYRVVNEFTTNGKHLSGAVTSLALGPMLAEDHPREIKAVVRFQPINATGIFAMHHGSDTYYWEHGYYVDATVFSVFTHRVLYGDPKTALKDPSSIAVSETFARTYFGPANPLGQTVSDDQGATHTIRLVFADQPPNTHLKYDLLIAGTFDGDPTQRRRMLWGASAFTYLLMAPDFDPASWPRISDSFFKRYMAGSLDHSWRSWLQPLAAIHLQSEVGYDLPTGNPFYVYGCAGVGLFILVVACINYMNLSTARAARSARSVGICKILGAPRWSLALQFISESLLFSLVSLVIAIAIVETVLKLTPLSTLLGGPIELNLRQEPALGLWLLGFALLLGLTCGLYPAFYLSSWAPLAALSSRRTARAGNLRLRQALVLVQLTISTAIIAAVLLMGTQMRYVAGKPLGFEKDNRLLVTLRGADTIEAFPRIRADLLRDSHVLAVAETQFMVGQDKLPISDVGLESSGGELAPQMIMRGPVGADFIKVMGLSIIQGRDFTEQLHTETGSGTDTSFLVNEALVRKMGWAEPLGRRVQLLGMSGHVRGVVRDFNFQSLHTLVEPLILYAFKDDFGATPPRFRPLQERMLVVRIAGTDPERTLGFVKRVITQIDPQHPFEYRSLDSSLRQLYQSEHRLTALISLFAGLCILIACLGLLGLAAFTTEQRTREIGTRKVLGATAWQIIALLSRETLLLVLIAGVLASVIAYLVVDQWLTGFAYTAPINPLLFVLATGVAAAVAFGTVALQAYRTARSDPVEGLRHD